VADLQRLVIMPVGPGKVFVQAQPQTMTVDEVKDMVRDLFAATEAARALETGGIVRPDDEKVVAINGSRRPS